MIQGSGKYNTAALSITVIVSELLFWLSILGIYLALKAYVPGIAYQRPLWFWSLLSLPVLASIYLLGLHWKNRRLRKLADLELVPYLFPELSSTRSILKFFLFRYAIACFLLGIIDPKIGNRLEEVKTSGIDLVVALDVSKSMLAEDITPNRLERAKQAISQLLNRLTGDRICLIVFAGDAYVQLPITTDYEAARLFLGSVDTDVVPVQGTALGTAIELGIDSFDPESTTSKAIIIITDGENHEDDAILAAEKAAELGITVHAIGMGSTEGAPIPEYNRSGSRIGFKKDASGNTVVSALDEDMLRKVVSAGNGIFTRASTSYVGLNELVDNLAGMEKQELGTFSFADYEHRFQWFLFAGIILLVLDTTVGSGKKKWSSSLSLFDA